MRVRNVTNREAVIEVGHYRWRWWADVQVKEIGAPPNPNIKTRGTSTIRSHDCKAWSEEAVRAKADRLASKLLHEPIDKPYTYTRRLPPQPTTESPSRRC